MLPFCTNQQQSTWEYGFLLQRLLQLRALRLGFFQNGDVRLGVLPQGEKVLVGGFRSGLVSQQRKWVTVEISRSHSLTLVWERNTSGIFGNDCSSCPSVLRPGWWHDASHPRVRDQLTHVFVGMNDDTEIHPIHRRFSVGDMDFTLKIVGFGG
jgi:hypothetical protein